MTADDDRKDRKERSEVIKCPICSRSFGSKKAMYGHMRCHPERGWRGVFPHATASSSSYKDIDSLSHSWSTTSTPPISQLISADASLPPKKRRYHRQYASSSSSSSSDVLDYYYHSKQAKAHECRSCHKTFPTGQALGGHQTTHRLKKKPAAAQATPRAVLDIDLNQLPPIPPMEQQD